MNQIWLVIPNRCTYKTGQENEILMTLHDAFFLCFVPFVGKTLCGSQVRTVVRETAREWWKVVHASRDPVMGGDGAEKGKDKKGFRVGNEVRWKRSRHDAGYLGMWEYVWDELGCIYDTIVLLSTHSRTSLYKGKRISLLNHKNTNWGSNCGAGGLLLTSGIG